jgi:hypothetical protein
VSARQQAIRLARLARRHLGNKPSALQVLFGIPFHFKFFDSSFLPWIMAIIINNITHFYMLRGLEWKWIW